MSWEPPRSIAAKVVHAFYKLLMNCIVEQHPEYCIPCNSTKRAKEQESKVNVEEFRKIAAKVINGIKQGKSPREAIYGALEEDKKTVDRDLERGLRCVANIYCCEALPTRISQFASLMASDIINAFYFYISRSDGERYKKLYKLFDGILEDIEKKGCEEIITNSDEKCSDSTTLVGILSRECADDGHTTILVMTAIGLRKLGVLTREPSELDKLLSSLVEAMKGSLYTHSNVVMDYIIALKRLLEGLFRRG